MRSNNLICRVGLTVSLLATVVRGFTFDPTGEHLFSVLRVEAVTARLQAETLATSGTWSTSPLIHEPEIEVREQTANLVRAKKRSKTRPKGSHDIEIFSGQAGFDPLLEILKLVSPRLSDVESLLQALPPVPSYRSPLEIKRWKAFFRGPYSIYLRAALKNDLDFEGKEEILSEAQRLDPLGHLPVMLESMVLMIQSAPKSVFDYWCDLLAPFGLYPWAIDSSQRDGIRGQGYMIYESQFRRKYSLRHRRLGLIFERSVRYFLPLSDPGIEHSTLGTHGGRSGEETENVFLDSAKSLVMDLLRMAFDPTQRVSKSIMAEYDRIDIEGKNIGAMLNQLSPAERRYIVEAKMLLERLKQKMGFLWRRAPELNAYIRGCGELSRNVIWVGLSRLEPAASQRAQKPAQELLHLMNTLEEKTRIILAYSARVKKQISADLDDVYREAARRDLADHLRPSEFKRLERFIMAQSGRTNVRNAIEHLNNHLKRVLHPVLPLPRKPLTDRAIQNAIELFNDVGSGDADFAVVLKTGNRLWTLEIPTDAKISVRLIDRLVQMHANRVGGHEVWHALTRALCDKAGKSFQDFWGGIKEFYADLPSVGFCSAFPRSDLADTFVQAITKPVEPHDHGDRMSLLYMVHTLALKSSKLALGHSTQVREAIKHVTDHPEEALFAARQLMAFPGIPRRLIGLPKEMRLNPSMLELSITEEGPTQPTPSHADVVSARLRLRSRISQGA